MTSRATKPSDAGTDADAERDLGAVTRGTARMASVAGIRQLLQTALLAGTAAVVARFLGPTDFGFYVGGTAAFNLAVALTDLGFSSVLLREMAKRPEEQGRLLRATMQLQTMWSVAVALGVVALGLAAGGQRGAVMLVLCPAVALAGLAAPRQLFGVRYRAAPLLITDLSLATLQAVVMITLAVERSGVIVLAVVLSAFTCLSGAIVTLLARRLVRTERPRKGELWQILRIAVPIGFASILASLYFTIDQLLLGWLVPARALGHYAAAVRLLAIVVMIPGFVMAAGLPGLARTADDKQSLSRFAATLSHWIAVSALPLCIGLAVFARPAIHLVFGPSYADSAALLQVLMIAAVLALVSNVTGITMISLSIIRPQVIFNTISLALNVLGNVVLAPRYGVLASAWLTVACEALIVSYGLVTLRRHVSYRMLLGKVWRPVAASALAVAPGLLLGAYRPYAIAASVIAFLIAMFALRAWPPDLLPDRLLRGRPRDWSS
ncbi:MAG: oligosaccharide flippase family protein [Actinomycetota bacterium]|nr:oligosaccharide flippase family protein [Actinomycetota bacterium]